MTQAITTYYLPCTNTRGSRICAKSAAGHKLTLSWDDEINADANHAAACQALLKKLGWRGRYIAGGLAEGSTVWVCDVDYKHCVIDWRSTPSLDELRARWDAATEKAKALGLAFRQEYLRLNPEEETN